MKTSARRRAEHGVAFELHLLDGNSDWYESAELVSAVGAEPALVPAGKNAG